jgi:hypothetical protein
MEGLYSTVFTSTERRTSIAGWKCKGAAWLLVSPMFWRLPRKLSQRVERMQMPPATGDASLKATQPMPRLLSDCSPHWTTRVRPRPLYSMPEFMTRSCAWSTALSLIREWQPSRKRFAPEVGARRTGHPRQTGALVFRQWKKRWPSEAAMGHR